MLKALLAGVVAATFVWSNVTVSNVPENRLRELIVAEHARVCSNTLTYNTQLVWIARYKAMDMLNNGYFAHNNPWSGRSIFDQMNRAGVRYTTGAEILAWNNYPDADSADAAFRQFMGSAGHRAAIQRCSYTRIGVGAYKAAGKKQYAVIFTG